MGAGKSSLNPNRDLLSLEEKQKLVAAIHHAEQETTGVVRVHFSHHSDETDMIHATKAHFEALGMHNTPEHNAMLLYVNPKLRKFCIFGDKGIHQKVKQIFWDDLSAEVSKAMREKDMIGGVVHAVEAMGHALRTHYPVEPGRMDSQLPTDITESD